MKQGVSMQVFVLIILAVASLVVIGPILYKFLSSGGDKGPEVVCQESVAIRAATATSLGPLKEAKIAPLLCKTIDKEISGNREEIKKELANLLARCWWMYNEGRAKEGVISSVPGFGSVNKGMVCYTVIIKENEQFTQSDLISPREFLYYLQTTDYKKVNKKYLDYIQSYGGPGRVLLLTEPGKGITPNSAFEIAFIEKSGDANAWLVRTLGYVGAGAAAAGGVILAVPSGGTSLSLTVTGIALLTGGATVATATTVAEWNQFFAEKDVSSIMMVDMSNQELRAELHKHVASGDLAGK